MVSAVVSCPHCHQAELVVRFGYNESGAARCQCKDCNRTFTPQPKSRAVTEEKEQRILAALSERLSIDAIARLLHVSKKTIYDTLKKDEEQPPLEDTLLPVKSDAAGSVTRV